MKRERFFHSQDNTTLNFKSDCVGHQFHDMQAWEVDGEVTNADTGEIVSAHVLVSYDTIVAMVCEDFGDAPYVVLFPHYDYSTTTTRQVTRWLSERLGWHVSARDLHETWDKRDNATVSKGGAYKTDAGTWHGDKLCDHKCYTVTLTDKTQRINKCFRNAPFFAINCAYGRA